MKYGYLAAWVREFEELKASVDRITLHQNTLYLRLIKAGVLVIVLSPQDSFIYHRESVDLLKKTSEIWPQLKGTLISQIAIKDNDRIISIFCEQKDIYGENRTFEIVCELMPPKPNVILINREKNVVVDALVRYSLADNPMRMVLANQPYYPPQTSFEPDKKEIIQIPANSGASSINDYFAQRHQKVLLPADSKSTLDSKIRLLNKELKRLNKKLDLQLQDLKNALKMDYYFACAEAIKPNMKLIIPGQEELIVTNYHDPLLAEIHVPLFPEKSPQQNLHYYLKKYQKAKSGKAIIEINLERTRGEIEAVQALISRMESGEDLDVDTHDKSSSIVQKINQLDRILQLRIDENWQVYIGRKAKENDFISTKLGKAQDWWFHSRIYRGAHVLLKNYRKQEVPAELIRACCALAAWYSQAKFSVNVPVDYTQVRYLRKPKGSAAGFITYTNYKTFFANPKDIRAIKEELGL
ncbi:MAG: NFACT RNA binding domain-containing protein [Candidatus Cloacimonetes bacterium]|jgi:predicted ribosome quality control (RQC) complex YloA/Tae2 family protein|nr:NFACT RNA binding domain-containing protein [Candidatus Cloacimonadota bacterium]MDD2507230.1 NFACT RNA binding domain-containing protein [Candidatus Cloacimonadota bacterium]MDD4560634.1 NFACT RNA binding domain-containing protein [Candidatus Cloacimonadota bacterium]